MDYAGVRTMWCKKNVGASITIVLLEIAVAGVVNNYCTRHSWR